MLAHIAEFLFICLFVYLFKNFLLFKGCIVFHCMHVLCPLSVDGHFGCSYILAIVNCIAVDSGSANVTLTLKFQICWINARSETHASYGISMAAAPILHSHQWCARILIPSHHFIPVSRHPNWRAVVPYRYWFQDFSRAFSVLSRGKALWHSPASVAVSSFLWKTRLWQTCRSFKTGKSEPPSENLGHDPKTNSFPPLGEAEREWGLPWIIWPCAGGRGSGKRMPRIPWPASVNLVLPSSGVQVPFSWCLSFLQWAFCPWIVADVVCLWEGGRFRASYSAVRLMPPAYRYSSILWTYAFGLKCPSYDISYV